MTRLVPCSLLFFATAAFADPGEPATLDDHLTDAMAAAQGAFVGTVVSIEYRESDPATHGETYPHTYVTWRVEHAFKGVDAGRTLTARFIGGPTADGRRTLVVSGLPQFDLGDRDVVFVSDNGASGCPLDRCAAGRLRIVDDLVYTDDGRGIALVDGRPVFGDPTDLPEVRETTIGGQTFRTSGDPAPRIEDPTPPSRELELVDWLDGVAREFPAREPAPSVSTRTPFMVEMRP